MFQERWKLKLEFLLGQKVTIFDQLRIDDLFRDKVYIRMENSISADNFQFIKRVAFRNYYTDLKLYVLKEAYFRYGQYL